MTSTLLAYAHSRTDRKADAPKMWLVTSWIVSQMRGLVLLLMLLYGITAPVFP